MRRGYIDAELHAERPSELELLLERAVRQDLDRVSRQVVDRHQACHLSEPAMEETEVPPVIRTIAVTASGSDSPCSGPIGDRIWDDGFDRVDTPAHFVVSGPGQTIQVEFGAGYPVAQIYAPRDVPRRHKFRYDRLYASKQGFWLDVRLILASFWITFRGKWEHSGAKI